ncbi:hypothetical protein JCM12141A_12420 [Mycolicibacterium hodleri]
MVVSAAVVNPAGLCNVTDWKKPSRPVTPLPTSWSHARIGVAATSPTGSTVTDSVAIEPMSDAAAANAAGVRAAKTSRGRSRRPSLRARLIRPIATMLSPPMAKKSASALTLTTPSSSAKMSQIARVRGSVGAAAAFGTAVGGAGSARRSSLPLAVTGNSSSTITAAGTMCSGSFEAHQLSRSSASTPALETT